MTLGSTAQSLKIALTAGMSTAHMSWVVAYGERSDASKTYVPKATAFGLTNGTTPVTMIAAPAAGAERAVARGSITNLDSAAKVVRIVLDDAGTQTAIKTVSLNPGDQLHYAGDGRWEVQDSQGSTRTGMIGPAGPRGGSAQIEKTFAFGDASPATLGTVPAGKLILAVELYITQAFGSTATLSVGDAGNVARLMAVTQNKPSEIGLNETHPGHRYSVDTAVTLTISPGAGATTGAGLVRVSFEE